MEKQIIITLGREFGSGGHEIGEKLAKKLGISLLDRSILEHIEQNYNFDQDKIEKYDEKSRKPFLSRTVRGYSNSLEDALFELQSKYILNKAESGESFVLIGRCGEDLLKDYPNMVSVFIRGDRNEKLARVMEIYKLDHDKAYEKMRKFDKKRKAYHNSRCESKWGDSRTYDLCINSSPIGVDAAIGVIESYINSVI